MHELTVTGTNQAGRPDTGDEVVVLNAADWRTFGDPVEAVSIFYHGSARYSVPAGTYWAFAWFAGPASPPRRCGWTCCRSSPWPAATPGCTWPRGPQPASSGR